MELTVADISKQIYRVRGVRVMLDSDLARLYQTETRILNQTVRRNAKRFPEDFMFQLHKDEFELLMSQIVISKKETRGGRQKLPLVFTELGVGMLSCILGSDRAIQTSIAALRAFAQAKHSSEDQTGLTEKVDFLKREIEELKQSQVRFESKFDSYLSFNLNLNLKLTESGTKTDAEGSAPAQNLPIASSKRPEELWDALPRKRSDPNVEIIQAAVSQYYRVSVLDLKSETRRAPVSLGRQVCMYLIRELTGISYQKIGFHFGGRDHTTVLHACGRIRSLLGEDIETREALSAIQSWLTEKGLL